MQRLWEETVLNESLGSTKQRLLDTNPLLLNVEQHSLLKKNMQYGYSHDENEIWQIANAKVEGTSPSEILEIKNNSPKQTDIVLVFNPDVFINLENSPEEFHKHYQNLAIREEQKQCLEEINT
ncbi:hypothetical protein G9A89_001162 [Geosiphon pyriformis]|nr:hypothetical protein G9A89_001162 [Geosiphon pyriformis]